jgi:hypothetical protein
MAGETGMLRGDLIGMANYYCHAEFF